MAVPQYGAQSPPPQPSQGYGGYGGYGGGGASLTPCEPGKRIVAAVIDGAIAAGISVAGWIVFMILASVTRFGLFGMFALLAYVAAFLYKPYFEVTKDGQTVGKKMQGIKVVKSDGSPIDWGAALIRQIILWFLGLIELIVVFVNNGIRVGDMAAKTVVIDADGATGATVGYGTAQPTMAPPPPAMPPQAPPPQAPPPAMPPQAPPPQAPPPAMPPQAPPPQAPPPAMPPQAPPPQAPPPAAPPQAPPPAAPPQAPPPAAPPQAPPPAAPPQAPPPQAPPPAAPPPPPPG